MGRNKEIYSIGHSSRKLEEFIKLLKHYGIENLVDIRSVPYSGRNPQFNRETLRKKLSEEGINYIHLEKLGGFREDYLSYTKSAEFRNALDKLMEISERGKTAFMCAEKNWRECHRRFVSAELAKEGFKVIHIIEEDRWEIHPKTLF